MTAGPRKRLARRVVIAGLLLVLAAGWARYFLTVPDPLYREPAIVRALLRHRAEFDDFVGRFRRGEVRTEPGRRYDIPRAAVAFSVREGEIRPSVYAESDCVFLFYFHGPGYGEEYLIHSPRGLAGIPDRYQTNSFFRVRPVTEEWFYMEGGGP